MSRAFVKESDQEIETLPERAISPHPNLVTAKGLERLDLSIRELEAERTSARSAGDTAVLARVARDLRYFHTRRETARLVTPPAAADQIRFGMTVRLALTDHSERTFQLVGEDEADPKQGLLSYVSPLATALMGKSIGEEVLFGGQSERAEIIALECDCT